MAPHSASKASWPPPLSPPRTPVDEAERLLALHGLGLLDTAPSESFDRVTRLAAKALGVPILLVSLVDESRQWFKACIGLNATETSREVSFCGHAVFERRPLVVNDATEDPRFAGNPLVLGAPHIRAYLGIPLMTLDGYPIGTLCAIDVTPRDFHAADIETLAEFAKIIEETIHTKELSTKMAAVLQLAQHREQLFRDTFEQAAVGIVHTSPSGELMRVNQRTCELLGYTEAELRAVRFVDITHPDDIPKNAQFFQRMTAGEIDSYRMEKRFLKKDGGHIWVYLSVALKRTKTGAPDYLIAVIEDMTEKKRLELRLIHTRDSLAAEVAAQTQVLEDRNSSLRTQISRVLESESKQREVERHLRSVANSVPAMIGYWNRDLRNEFANETYRVFFGLAPEKIVGMTMRELMGEALYNKNLPFAKLALAGHEQHFERTLKKYDGAISFTDARYVPDMDERGEIRGFFVLVTDITPLRKIQAELEAVNAQLKIDSSTDYLTGLANRRVFSERSEQAAAEYRRCGAPYGLIILDVDNFKRVNDHYGHDTGDEVLRLLGRVLKAELRGGRDLAARLGGEELAVLCFGDLQEDSLYQMAERIRHQISRETCQTRKGPIKVTCSFGAALGMPEDVDWKGIYARADAALYEAKLTGKDRVVFGRTALKGSTGRFRAIRPLPNG